MQKNKIITGLDIGSSKVSAVTASMGKDGVFGINCHATQDSRGISRGTITDINEAVRSVSSVLKKLKPKSLGGLGDIYVNISGETLKGAKSKGMIPISTRGREITAPDMVRCIDAASTVHLPFDREIVHKIVQRFSVDDEPWIKDPLGIYASRLACEVYIITAGTNSIQNIFKCVNNAGYDVKEVVYTGIADGSVVLDSQEKESGVILLSMGAALTEISTFFGGSLSGIEILQTGTGDFKDSFNESAAFAGVVSTLTSRLAEFRIAHQNAASVVVTGGVIFSDGVIEYLEEKLSCPVRMGVAKNIRGDISGLDSVRLTTAIGLAGYAAAKYEKFPQRAVNFAGRISSKVVDIFNSYF